MKRITLNDFSGGMLQRISPDDYEKGQWGWLQGFVPENATTIRSQWPIQTMANEEGTTAENWSPDGNMFSSSEPTDTSAVISVYPIQSTSGVFLVAIKANGTLWWLKAPDYDAPTSVAISGAWKRIGYNAATNNSEAENLGFNIYNTVANQPKIVIEENPDYRFICELPLEVYKYIKEPQDNVFDTTTPTKININASHGGWEYSGANRITASAPTEDTTSPYTDNPPTKPWFLDFTKDALPDGSDSNDAETPGDSTVGGTGFTRSLSSAVLIHSRRYYRDGRLTRTKDYDTKKLVTNKQTTTNTTKILTVGSGHGFVVNDLIEVFIGDSNYDGFQQITATTSTTITYIGKSSSNENVIVNNNDTIINPFAVVQKYHRNQTAVVAYVDPYSETVKAVTFPNFRRWPMYPIKITDTTTYQSDFEKDQSKLFNAEYRPMQSWVVTSTGGQKEFPFIDKYPYDQTVANSKNIWAPDIQDYSGTKFQIRSAYPKYNANFHPYTYLNADKSLLPGRGLVPRAFTGTMLGSVLILGDIEWKQDSSNAFTSDKRLVPTKNKVAGSSTNSNFGLRDSNTEPHRGFLYYSQDDIDIFDPRSVLRASGTDTRISSMHNINNKVVTVTTSGGPRDGIITFSGNFGALHPYTPGVLANPLAVRKEVILGGVGTADTVDWYNHGNPQSCLWPEFGKVAFIDKTGYVILTNGETAETIDENPLRYKPNASTVNDHVAAVGKYLFVYKNGYLFVYTINNGRGAWYLLVKPFPIWPVRNDGNLGEPGYYNQQYNVIKSMRGINNELYFVVHSYWIDCDADGNPTPIAFDENDEPIEWSEPVFGSSRVMRFALSGLTTERGCQDGLQLDGLDIITPTMGIVDTSKKVFWREAGINFYTEHGCDLVGAGVIASYPKDKYESISYEVPGGVFQSPFPNIVLGGLNIYGSYGSFHYASDNDTPAQLLTLYTYTEGFHNYELSTGVGPQRVMSVRFTFRGDVSVEAVNIGFTGEYDLKGDA